MRGFMIVLLLVLSGCAGYSGPSATDISSTCIKSTSGFAAYADCVDTRVANGVALAPERAATHRRFVQDERRKLLVGETSGTDAYKMAITSAVIVDMMQEHDDEARRERISRGIAGLGAGLSNAGAAMRTYAPPQEPMRMTTCDVRYGTAHCVTW